MNVIVGKLDGNVQKSIFHLLSIKTHRLGIYNFQKLNNDFSKSNSKKLISTQFDYDLGFGEEST